MHSRWFWGVVSGAMLAGLLLTGYAAQRAHAIKREARRCYDRAEAAARAASNPGAESGLPIHVVSTSGNLNSGLHLSTRPVAPARFLSPANVDEERLAAALKEKGIRLYPYPYSHVFSFCSDCDSCKISDFIRYHELLNHRFGLDVGDSAFLFNQASGRLGFFDAASLEYRGCALIPYYHRGWIDVLHGFSEDGSRVVPLVPPGTQLAVNKSCNVIASPTATRNEYANPVIPVTKTCALHALVLGFLVPDLQADLILVGPQNREHCVAINRKLGGRPGWEVETPDTTLDILVDLQQEQNVSEAEAIHALGDIVAVRCAESNYPAPIVRKLAGLAITRDAVISGLSLLRKEFNVSFSTITDHSCTYFFGTDKKLEHQLYTMADVPQSYVYLTDFLLGRAGVEFINPAVWTSESAPFGVLAAAVPTRLRDGYRAYLARRRCYAECLDGKMNISWNCAVPRIIETFLKKTGQEGHALYVYYTHLGHGDPKYPDAYGPAFQAAAAALADRVYNPRGDVPLSRRVWVARPTTLYKYSQMLKGIPSHLQVEGNTVSIARWQDEVLQKVFPDRSGTKQLHGLTVYVPDARNARLLLDGEELTCFKRNPPDETGRSSITVVDDSTPRVIFDEVDFCYHHADMTNEPIGWDKDVGHISTNLGYYLRQGSAPRGVVYGELQLTAGGSGEMTVDTPWLDGCDTYYLRFKYRKSSPRSLFGVGLKTEDGHWHWAAEEGWPECGEMGWRLPAREDRRWHDCVLEYADQQPDRAQRKSHLQQKIVAIGFRVKGNAQDSFFFDQIELLRPDALPEDPLRRKVVGGVVEPPRANVAVKVSYGVGQGRTTTLCRTDEQGYFHVAGIPRGSVVDVTAECKGRVALPKEGRYIELYSDQADLHVPLTPSSATFDPKLRIGKGETAVKDFGTTYVPRSEVVSAGLQAAPQCFQVTHQMNNLGFFDRDRRIENPDRNPRIVIAGTCLLEGQQVNLGEHANMQLEQILLERTGRYCEAPNLSFSFLSPSAFLPYYDGLVRKLSPAVLIMSFGQGGELLTNDWDLESKRAGYDPAHPPGHVFTEDKQGKLVSLPRDPNSLAFMGTPLRQAGDDGYNVCFGVNWLKELCRKDRQYAKVVEDAIRRYVAILTFYRQHLAKDHVRLLFVLTTEIELMNFSAEWRENGVTYGTKYYADNIAAIFAKADVPLLVLSKSFKKKPKPTSAHWVHDTHFSRAGARWCAEAIADFLIDNHWIPEPGAGEN